MSRLSIPRFQEPAAAPPAVEEVSTVTMTEAELDQALTKAHDAGFDKGVKDAEERVRGLEKAELEKFSESLDERHKLVEQGVVDAERLLRDLAARCEKYNDKLDDCLEEAASSMAAQLLIEVNRAEQLVEDLIASLKERHRVTSIAVSAPPSLSAALRETLEDVDELSVEESTGGQALSISLATDAGPLRYSLQETAEELHRRLVARGARHD